MLLYATMSSTSIRIFLTNTAPVTLVLAIDLSKIDYCNSPLFRSTHDGTYHLQRVINYEARVILPISELANMTLHLK